MAGEGEREGGGKKIPAKAGRGEREGNGLLFNEGDKRDNKSHLACGNAKHPAEQVVFQFGKANVQMLFGDKTCINQFPQSVCLHFRLFFRHSGVFEFFKVSESIKG